MEMSTRTNTASAAICSDIMGCVVRKLSTIGSQSRHLVAPTGCAGPNHHNLLSSIVVSLLVIDRMEHLSFKFVLPSLASYHWVYGNVTNKTHHAGKRGYFGDASTYRGVMLYDKATLQNVQGRTKARCKNEVLDMEDTFAAISAFYGDIPLFRRVLRSACDGGGRPHVQFKELRICF